MNRQDKRNLVETGIVLARELPNVGHWDLTDAIMELSKQAKIIQRYSELYCERELFPIEVSRNASAEQKARHIAESLGVDIILQEDVRGAPIKLILPSGRSNSFGGIGWCIPF